MKKKTEKEKIPMDWHGSWLGSVGGIGQSIKTKFCYLLWKEEGKIINTCDYTLSPALCVCVCVHTHKCALELQTNPI